MTETAFTISIVVVKVIAIDLLNIMLSHLNSQTIAEQIELIVLVEDEASRVELETEGHTDQLGQVVTLVVGPIHDPELALMHGYRAATTPIVAHIEDHAFASSDWAEAVVEAHESGAWAAVGTPIDNANPATLMSWAVLLPAYGYWLPPVQAGPSDQLMRLNVSFKRHLVMAHNSQLEALFGRGRNLHQQLQSDGYDLYVTDRGMIHHTNPSRIGPAADLLLQAGRIYGSGHFHRPLPVRIALALGTLLFPLIRFVRRYQAVFGGRPLRLKLLVAFMIGLKIQAMGNALGFLFGEGDARKKLAHSDMNRFSEVTSTDYQHLINLPPNA